MNIIIVIKLGFITRLNKKNLARKRVTEISKNNENKSKRSSLTEYDTILLEYVLPQYYY